MTSEGFEAFCAALEHQDEEIRLRRATAFWERLGEPEPAEMSIDSLAYAQSARKHSAADLLTHAAELGYTEVQIDEAAVFAARCPP
jgi:hypothetical protein